MLVIFAVIIGGIATGRLLIGRRLAFVPRLITVIIWALLFLLGVEVGFRPCGRGFAGDTRRGGAGDLRPLRRGEHLRRVAVVAADSRTRRACRRRGGRRRCPGLRMGGPLRQSRDRRLLRGGMCRGTFRAVRPGRIAGQRLRALCADVLRGRSRWATTARWPDGFGGSIRGWHCCPSPQPSGRWPGPLWRLRCSPNGR